MQNQGEDQPCRIKLEWLPTKHQVPKQGAREFLRLTALRPQRHTVGQRNIGHLFGNRIIAERMQT